MKKFMYTLLDIKAQAIDVIFLAENDEVAIRSLAQHLPPNSLPAQYPKDFALLRLGDVAMGTGVVTGVDLPVHVALVDEIFARYGREVK